jgi:medium-chain acyl-[acyl-carrier-protein] hydrolase
VGSVQRCLPKDVVLFREPNVQSAEVVLFALGWAGAGAAVFQPWAESMPRRIELAAIRLPGRESRFREAVRGDIGSMADSIAASAVEHARGAPIALLGICTGAIVMVEVARRLEAASSKPLSHLVLVSPAPRPASVRERRRLSELPVRDVLTSLGHTADAILANDELLALLEPALRADLRAVETFRGDAGPRLVTPIQVFLGHHDSLLSETTVADWSEETDGAFAVEFLPGDHLFSGPAWPLLGRAVMRALLAAGAE